MLHFVSVSPQRVCDPRCLYEGHTSRLCCLPHLEPAVNPIRASKTGLDGKDLARFERRCPSLDYGRKILRMNDTDAAPAFQILICFAKILQFLAVEKRGVTRCPRRIHEPGYVVDDLPPGELAGPQHFLSPLTVLDVYTGSVPFDDVARLIPQRIGANQEPSIGTVELANPRFNVDR